MRAPRWAFALTAVAAAGTGVFITLPAGPASADASAPAETSSTYVLSAQGDAQYYQIYSQSVPASPNVEASSLVAHAALSNGVGSAFASSPYYGTTGQNLPGTAAGLPSGFGFALPVPFTRVPGYIECRTPDKANDEGGWYTTKVDCGEESVVAHGQQGAPASVPAPNQQETADAVVQVAKGVATATASGTAAGFVQGPLELGYATAQAKIVDTTAKGTKPTVTSTSFGRFSVNGQEFGFNQDGFRYLGQGMSSKDAIAQANTALKSAGIQLDLVPITQETDAASGATVYTIGGLKVTTTQTAPGLEPATITFILGRAQVSSLNEALDFGASAGVDNAGADSGAVDSAADNSSTAASATDATATDASLNSGVDAVTGVVGQLPALGDTVGAISGLDAVDPLGGTVIAGENLPKTLGFVPVAGQSGDNSEWLYATLLLAGLSVLGGHFLFGRFAIARKGA